ncbi:hypothetical protein NAL32_02600 [Chryseobacterium sp. Ch-15]|uniref:Peptidase M1 membrane alanine aminopeptidase domain-containing protein n=1 Tax=Chryseobacterium muglaense TaxID=2893752 RepID=A0A9Q3UX32_9FLAO|nr:hypothetical protein [Chryseobacterium muglaense]MBD3903323.1 hypothetical protein [Chryseobacterium muglaense]MCC9036152.1 hypothetical protein [Chryseobacterium muglaense]MCM2553273.1 hypothetical protein [Chryseobacterium muglaense]
MKPNCFLIAISFIFWMLISSNHILAQNSSAPHISGKVRISMKDGLIASDIILSNIPIKDTAFRINLNRGMNIKLFKDSATVLKYNNPPGDEYISYRLHNGKGYVDAPKKLNITYSGAFPIYNESNNFYDYQGVIALNGKTLRATNYSKWYPVIYDTKNDTELLDMTYDLMVECTDCKTIFLNGSEAQPGPIARFKSEKAYGLLLFTGDYEVQKFSESNFLNAEMPVDMAEAFNKQISSIKGFLESKLEIPYGQKITFIQHKAIEPYGPNKSWGFVVFPSIAVAGGRFNDQIDMKTKKFNHLIKCSFYAHELSHYYFGTVLIPDSTLRWFFLESIPEYLSVKATEKEYGKQATVDYINNAKTFLEKKTIIPLSKITKPEQIDDVYRYTYGPLLLLALEKKVGEKKIYKMFQKALAGKNSKTDYSFLVKIAKEAAISGLEWKSFEDDLINNQQLDVLFEHLNTVKK